MNGDPVKSLVGQMGETKERVAAWAFRGLTTLVMICLAIIGYFVQDKLGTFNQKFDTLDQQRQQVWKAVGDQSTLQKSQGETMIRLETTLADHIATENNILQSITGEAKDHEDRIRDLEGHPARHP